jgi:HEAT repeat protein
MKTKKKTLNSKLSLYIILMLGFCLLSGTVVLELNATQSGQNLKDILQQLTTYKQGQNDEIILKLNDYIRKHRKSPESRAVCEEELLFFLDSDSTLEAKMEACRHLRIIGSEKSVPVLEKKLLKKETTDMARYALEKIPGISAEKALLNALSKTRGEIRRGIISSLGQRKVADAVTPLGMLIHGSDVESAFAAVTALGWIATPEAVEVLVETLSTAKGNFKAQAASSLLKCAEKFQLQEHHKKAAEIYNALLSADIPASLRWAAGRGKILTGGAKAGQMILDILKSGDKEMYTPAIGMISDDFDDSSLKAVCNRLPELPVENQAQLLMVLSRFQRPEVLAVVKDAVKSQEKRVRIAALEALCSLGDASMVNFFSLYAAESTGVEQSTARKSLWNLKGEGVDQAVLAGLEKNSHPQLRNELIRCIEERRIKEGQPVLFTIIRDAEPENRIQAMKALKVLAELSDLSRLINIMLEAKIEREQNEMTATIVAVAGKNREPHNRGAAVVAMLPEVKDVRGRAALYRTLGKIGDDSTLAVLRLALAEKNEDIRDAAIRALSEWPTLTARDDVFRIAKVSDNPTHQVLTLRALIRMIGMEEFRLPQAAVESLKAALKIARRSEEKKTVLGMLPKFACRDALELAESMLEDKDVMSEAQAAVDKIKVRLKK